MIIISDTTPIISLIKTGHLELLRILFGEVLIPTAVFDELTSNHAFEKEAEQVRVTGLDAGESEAIVLADERKSDLLLMDEHKGRSVAKQLGLTLTGTIGILLQAYDEKILSKSEVESCLEKMQDSRIRISNTLYDLALRHMK